MSKKIKTILAIILLVPCLFLFCSCQQVQDGKSAYEIAVEHGFNGTEEQWLESLRGEDGNDGDYAGRGKSAYEIALDNGFVGSEAEWLESLKGEKGDAGDNGMQEAISKASLSTVSIISGFYYGTTLVGESAGSGVIIQLDKQNGDAYIITNYHVVYFSVNGVNYGICNDIQVYLYGMEYTDYQIEAQYVGGSMTNDIAVLKIDNSAVLKQSNAIQATINTEHVRVGQPVATVGNPAGSGISSTQGIISVDSEYIPITLADEKTLREFRVMRVDAAINGGNSGGGLFDAKGNLIGIVNAKIVSEEIENIGFAIPIVVGYGIAQNIILQDNGANTGNINAKVCVHGVTTAIKESKAVYDPEKKVTKIVETVEVESVNINGLAYGKLYAGDKLLSIEVNGTEKALDRQYLFEDWLYYFESGDTIKITVLRDGVTKEVSFTVTSQKMKQVL